MKLIEYKGFTINLRPSGSWVISLGRESVLASCEINGEEVGYRADSEEDAVRLIQSEIDELEKPLTEEDLSDLIKQATEITERKK